MSKKFVSKIYYEEPKKLGKFDYLDNVDDEYYVETNGLFDLNTLNVSQLIDNLQKSINKKPSRFLMFRERENKKIRLETEKVQLLTHNLTSVRSLGQEMLQLQADAILTAKTLSYLVANKRKEFQMEFEKSVEEHYTKVHIEKTKRDLIDINLFHHYLDNVRREAEIEAIKANTKEQEANAEFLIKVADRIDKMSDEALAYMFHSFITRKREIVTEAEYKDFNMDGFFRDYMKKNLNEEVKAKKYENMTAEAKAKFEKWKSERKMNDSGV